MRKSQGNKICNVLFLCTGNSCRSIMAEGLLNSLSNGRFNAYSAGSHPTGTVNPKALETLSFHGIYIDTSMSKSWDEFQDKNIDLVVTVCRNVANETCPVFPGSSSRLSWFIEDPAEVKGTDEEIQAAFDAAFFALKEKIESLINDVDEGSQNHSLKLHVTG